MNSTTSLHRLALILGLRFGAKGVGDASVRALLPAINEHGDGAHLLDMLPAHTGIKSAPRAALLAALGGAALEQTMSVGAQLVADAERHDVGVVVYDDPRYPALLKHTHDAPAVLFVRGTLPHLIRTVACVGTRNPSKFGIAATQGTTTALAEAGWTIVSGLAVGIDTVAHRAALQAGAPTVAIVGNGLDTVYPSTNKALAAEIVDHGGALISEQPFGEKATASNLVRRDRLQSGMSVATCVFESAADGGAMHAARAAHKYGRLVVCPVPTGPYQALASCSGIQQLLRNGAYPIVSRDSYGPVLQTLEQRLHQASMQRSLIDT